MLVGALAVAVPTALAASWLAGRGLRARKPIVPAVGSYVCTELEGRDLVEGTELRVTFAEGWMDVFAGCNNLSGTIYSTGSRLYWSEEASTEVGCRPDMAVQDAWLSGWLNAGVDVFRDHRRIVLSGQGVRAVLSPAGSSD
jgi:heat shock protein HslJ